MNAEVRPKRLGPSRPDRPLAVFVHGLEDDWRSWRSVSESLGDGWDTVALDMPWRAGNDYGWRWTAPPASWIATGLDRLDRKPDLLVGHSFGANASLEAVAREYCGAGALAMIVPFYRAPEPRPTWRTWNRSREAFEFQMREAVRARLGGRLERIGEALVESMTDKVFERIGLTGFLAVFEQYVASGHLPMESLGIPVLVVAGERDPGASRAQLSRLTGALPDATLTWHAEFDHFCHIRHAEQVAELLTRFAASPTAHRAERSEDR
ncbi:alpha/beta fold hydrolase [Saccharomonospora cyanea]|uniref:Putative hydrolase or acyltransferase of alpha/beta superfamily n=1 Tax=Saccharomonospora cyanea NA-134 TaxID=882082 RepID=H5XI78_9PSEU|nr:alpha/beta hydrolase [Saccharomonospora cyanea]EHR61706.1 putative hydrolase or acyltransferase of alpha/beta superfamily [Saccharomonospora cyanea NA-134]